MQAGRGSAAFTAFAIAAVACLGGASPAMAAAKPTVGQSDAKAAAGTSRAVTTKAKAATSTIVGAGDPGAIAGEYIVVLQGVTGPQVAAEATALTTQYGGTVGDEYTDVLQGFSMAATSAQATAMTAATAVSYVEQDETDSASGLQVLPPATGSGPAPLWNLDRIDQRTNTPQNLYNYRNTASSVTAYVVDSGILITNTDFQGRASYGFNALAPGTAATDCNGHGTHVAGTLGGATYGVAKSVSLVAVKVLNCDGSGSASGLLDGLDWVDQNAVQPAVVNMSLGFGVSVPAIDTAVTNLSQSLTVIVAAGNDSVDASTVSPAEAPGPTVVGATDSTDAQASFSNFGSRVDIYAPGVDILSDYWTSNTATETLSGTSMAAPAVAGAAAMILQNDPGLTPAQVKTTLIDNATSGTQSSPVINGLGTGSPDRLLYVPPPSVTVTVGGPSVSQAVGTGANAFDFTFAGTAGQTAYINGTGGSFDASMTLYDPHGLNLGTGNHASYLAGTREIWIDPVNLPLTGTYTLHIIPASGATGTVSAQVLTYATTAATVGGAAVSATIPTSLPGQRISATFIGTAGQTVYINGTGGPFDTSMTLDDPKGTQIAEGGTNSDESGAATTWISATNLDLTGTYTLIITPVAGATGTLSFQVIASDVTVSATVGGSAVSATIPTSTPGRRVVATFAGTAGQTVYINGTGGSFDTSMVLYDPKGAQIATGGTYSDESDVPTSWISPTNLDLNGTYTLILTPDADATGTLSFQVIASYVTASTGVNGVPTTVTIPSSTPGQIMAITFSGNAGSSVSMLGITGAVSGTLTMYDPDGIQVATGIAIPLYPCPDDGVPGTCPQIMIAPVTIPLSGTYTVYFTPDAADTGSISVWVTGVSGSAPTVTVIPAAATVDGPIVPVTISTPSAANRVAVSFSGTAGQAVYINNSSNTMSCGSDSYSLVGPSGKIVMPSFAPALELCNLTSLLPPTGLPTTGTYTLYIVPDGSQSGTANLQILSEIPVTSATVNGAITPVTIPSTSPGQIQAISFAGTAGQAVYLNNGSNTMSCGEDSYSLIGPSGQIIVPSYSPILELCNLTLPLPPTGLPVTGTYTFYIVPDGRQQGTANLQALSYGP